MKKISIILSLVFVFCVLLSACGQQTNYSGGDLPDGYIATVDDVPEFDGKPYVAIANNVPDFSQSELTVSSFEKYSELDLLDRCGQAYACISKDLMPTEERGSIGQVKPSGWQTIKYDIVDGKYLYNRCHLIGFQLTGENANEKNLITGTRYMNVEGMLPFENMVADYIKETGNHVLYRVTPVYDGINLVARGVQMEALSVEDGGDGICFNVYVYNNQPGVVINYLTGESHLNEDNKENEETSETQYFLNTGSKKIHLPSCTGAEKIKEENKKVHNGDISNLIAQGYTKCKLCFD